MLRAVDGTLRASLVGQPRLLASPMDFARTVARARPRCGRLLSLRSAADRGLLRRQQADEGLHRHRPMSTPIRGCAWRPRSPGHRRAFGADTVPGTYEDLDLADLIVLVGSNAAWCHPVLYQRMAANKRARGARIVVIDPRRTAHRRRRRPVPFNRTRHGYRAVRWAAGHLADTYAPGRQLYRCPYVGIYGGAHPCTRDCAGRGDNGSRRRA